MKAFLEKAKTSDHATMMISHIMGDQPMDMENCPMKDSQAAAPLGVRIVVRKHAPSNLSRMVRFSSIKVVKEWDRRKSRN